MEQELKLVIEGQTHPWQKEIILVEEVIALGGWESAEGVVGIGHDDQERPMKPGETAHLAHHKEFRRLPFTVVIEGKTFGWHSETISIEEIARLGGWDVTVGVIEVDEETNDERQVGRDERVKLHHHRHHHNHHKSFGKKHKWKRG